MIHTEKESSTGVLSICVMSRFYPSVGGIETLSEILARKWVEAGHYVTIVTDVKAAGSGGREFPFLVLHDPSPWTLLQAVRRCDVVLHHQISLKAIWPLLAVRRPLVAVHHSMYRDAQGMRPLRETAKVLTARYLAHSVSVSLAVQQQVGCSGVVIPNLYDDECFFDAGGERRKDLVFVGRLVSDKGANVLLDALGELRKQGMRPALTFLGDGPERERLESQTRRLGLQQQVAFEGIQDRSQIARRLNQHKVLVVPSLWDEPFGIVALEGAACGCVVVGSQGGGLPEAIGPCGRTFPNGDDRRLAAVLAELLSDPAKLAPYRAAAPAHLDSHRANVVSAAYLDFITNVVGRPRALEAAEVAAHRSIVDRKTQELKSHVG
jgi:glycosyltransferase involved in cell wall biosynthesis